VECGLELGHLLGRQFLVGHLDQPTVERQQDELAAKLRASGLA
jgi:hypothetical protein